MVADIKYQAHVVVDKQQRRAIVNDLAQQHTKRPAFVGVKPSGGLIKQNKPGGQQQTRAPR